MNAYVTIHACATGVELRAVGADGQRMTLVLSAPCGLTLADQITMVCDKAVKA